MTAPMTFSDGEMATVLGTDAMREMTVTIEDDGSLAIRDEDGKGRIHYRWVALRSAWVGENL